MRSKYKNIPNLLSSFRVIIAPFLLVIAWQELPNLFLAILAVSLLSDALDGFLARRLGVTSKTGAKLDSWGDFATYCTFALCAWWLWPEVLKREAVFVVLLIGAFTAPFFIGLIKFGRLPSYHTWSSKAAAVFISVSVFILFMMDISWPFRYATIFQALSASEEIAITAFLSEWRYNVPSLWHARMQVIEDEKPSREAGQGN